MSDIKKYFTSRFGKAGYIMEVDYSQLEVFALAFLSQDRQLIADLLSGVDLHRVRAAEWLRISEHKVTDKQRKKAKRLSFQLQYGAGYKSMSRDNGISEKAAKDFINSYYRRYPQVLTWQDRMQATVIINRQPSNKRTPLGLPAGQGKLRSLTGRDYVFTEGDAPHWMSSTTSFRPTEIKNYPVQGFATGDIVQMMLGVLYRHCLEDKEFEVQYFMVNTVHDSIVLDVHEDLLYTIGREVKEVLESAPWHLKDKFGIDFNLPLHVEVTAGRNWLEQQPLQPARTREDKR